MYARSNSVTLSIQTSHDSFVIPTAVPVRSMEPKIFTFDRIPIQAATVRTYAPVRPKKRCMRVMYPAKVRKYLPPAEKSPAKRWLLALCLVVLWQIYTEEPCLDTKLADADSPSSEYQVLPFRSAEAQARQLTDISDSLSVTTANCEDRLAGQRSIMDRFPLNNTCQGESLDTEVIAGYEQSPGNGYMVALLVYHRLGSEN